MTTKRQAETFLRKLEAAFAKGDGIKPTDDAADITAPEPETLALVNALVMTGRYTMQVVTPADGGPRRRIVRDSQRRRVTFIEPEETSP